MTERNTNRLKIKDVVQKAVPLMDIDVTKVLSDEECAALHKQMEQRAAAIKTAAEVGRAGLRDRLKKTVLLATDDIDLEEEKASKG